MSRLVIWAGWLIDGSGEPAVRNALLHVENSVIQRVESGVRPSGENLGDFEDFSGCTLLPGLIDAHVHLFISGSEDPQVRERQPNQPFERIRRGIDRRLADLANHGVVACRDGGDRRALTLRYKRQYLSHRRGPVALQATGFAWRRHGRYGRLIGRPVAAGQHLAAGIAAACRFIDHIKIINSGLNSLLHFGRETQPQFDTATLRAAVAAGERAGLKTMVHANGEKPVEIALRAGCHSIEHGFFMGTDNLKRMADEGVFWVPTAVTMQAYHRVMDRQYREPVPLYLKKDGPAPRLKVKAMAEGALRNLEHQLEQLGRARKMGVPVAVGTDSGSTGVLHGASVSREMRLLTAAGYSIAETVRCACANGAELLGLENYGRLEKGMPAAFVAVNGPPEDLLENLAAGQPVRLAGFQ